jgi:hypothetical protein
MRGMIYAETPGGGWELYHPKIMLIRAGESPFFRPHGVNQQPALSGVLLVNIIPTPIVLTQN